VLIGLTGFWPGNNQPPGNIAPWRRPSSHHVLSRVKIGRQHGVAIPATLAAFDTNEHPLAVDIADLLAP